MVIYSNQSALRADRSLFAFHVFSLIWSSEESIGSHNSLRENRSLGMIFSLIIDQRWRERASRNRFKAQRPLAWCFYRSTVESSRSMDGYVREPLEKWSFEKSSSLNTAMANRNNRDRVIFVDPSDRHGNHISFLCDCCNVFLILLPLNSREQINENTRGTIGLGELSWLGYLRRNVRKTESQHVHVDKPC